MIRINPLYEKNNYGPLSTSFKGHYGTERYAHNSLKKLVKETGFFRNLQTKEFVVDYIYRNFSQKPNIKILVGACSSGEEAYTYSMLLDKLKEKISILGFDLGKKSIEDANSKKFLMLKPRKDPGNGLKYIYRSHETLRDSFLCFEEENLLTEKEEDLKSLFKDFFEITDETVPETKKSLKTRFNRFILKFFWQLVPNEYDKKVVKLKNGKDTNCSFEQGDILKLNEITKGEKADVITFANAMYHLICDESIYYDSRALRKDAEQIVEKIAINIKNNLNQNGIFVLGEDEDTQTKDYFLVNRIFKRNGFEPLNETFDHDANVWRLK